MKELRYQLRYAVPLWIAGILTGWLPDNRWTIRIRGALFGAVLPGKPKRLNMGRDVTLLGADRLHIGDDVYIAKGCWINGIGRITVGSECVFSPYVVMSSSRHGFRGGSVRFGGSKLEKVQIGQGCWLAAHAVVNAGTTIGAGSVVSAGSFVSGTFADGRVLRGNPAVDVGENWIGEGDVWRAR